MVSFEDIVAGQFPADEYKSIWELQGIGNRFKYLDRDSALGGLALRLDIDVKAADAEADRVWSASNYYFEAKIADQKFRNAQIVMEMFGNIYDSMVGELMAFKKGTIGEEQVLELGKEICEMARECNSGEMPSDHFDVVDEMIDEYERLLEEESDLHFRGLIEAA